MSIIEFSDICRTCLKKGNNLKCIFTQESFNGEDLTITEALLSFVPIQIDENDGLPQQMCNDCLKKLNEVFVFKSLCKQSDVKLKYAKLCKENIGDLNQIFDALDKNEEIQEKNKHPFITNTFKQGAVEKCDYNCSDCGIVCKGLGEYGKHLIKFHKKEEFKSRKPPNNPQKITKCNSKKQNKENAIAIKTKRRSTKNSSICKICNKTFRFASILERHKLVHSGEKPFLCNVCGSKFSQMSYLKIHSYKHTGEKPYKCSICERSFAAKGTLVTHIRTHTGEKPHICKICGKHFPQSGYLSAHSRIHTGEKPLECKVCSKRFNQSSRLTTHMRIHSGEKPYSCSYCERKFAIKGTLKKHIRTHTGERPYVCSTCGQTFAQSGTLLTHMKIHK